MKYTIGSDPEVFLKNTVTGKVDSVIGLLGGTKKEPISIGQDCSVQEDNILAEFNIPPVDNVDDFKKYINFCKSYIEVAMLPSNMELYYSSSEMIDDSILESEAAKTFGCAPSTNVLTQTISSLDPDEIPPELLNLRTSGFHIHYGYPEPNDEHNIRLVFAHELMVSLSLGMYDNDEHDRRRFYGKFGDCRSKDYGVECRSLGGAMLKDDYFLELVWEGIENTLKLTEEDSLTTEEIKEMVDHCIKENDRIDHKNILGVRKDLFSIIDQDIKETIN